MHRVETSEAHIPVLEQPVVSLANVGPTRARELRERGVHTLQDLLEYFPRSYRHENAECPIAQLTAGPIHIARGEVTAVDYIASCPRPRFEATVCDGPHRLALTWFNGAYLRGRIHPGQWLRVQGPVRLFHGIPQMTNPKWEVIELDAAPVGEDKFRAVYPAGARLSSGFVEKLVEDHLDRAAAHVPEWFEPAFLDRNKLMARPEAFRLIHRPANRAEALQAHRRLVYDELMLLQLGLLLSKRLRGDRLAAPAMKIDRLLDQRIRRRFPFQLTSAQQRVVWEIVKDLQQPYPMNRLLQGDVGSGKTIVALYAMLVAVANKYQAAILAPTEVLAEQHFLTLASLLGDSNVSIELFTGRTRKASRGSLVKHLASGRINVAIGTQALIQESIEFAQLGLVVVDEQHKLGVRQRATLKSKGLAPHYLVMTATPIPRTLALSYFADFDVSVIDELPPGRQPIHTQWLRLNQADEAYRFVRQHVQAGRQAYVVVPQIDDNGLDDTKSVMREYERLSQGILRELRLAILHGQMDTEEKQKVMHAFRAGQSDVLVATTVIEVGIDVANATVMVIENADRFGLSQLHQLRGRVGRGAHASHCLLIGDAISEDAQMRMQSMVRTTDGFEIAETDLKLRGPGEFFGTRQHGLPQFKLADITQELDLLQQARQDATHLLEKDPNLASPAHQALRAALTRQFGQTLALAQVG